MLVLAWAVVPLISSVQRHVTYACAATIHACTVQGAGRGGDFVPGDVFEPQAAGSLPSLEAHLSWCGSGGYCWGWSICVRVHVLQV